MSGERQFVSLATWTEEERKLFLLDSLTLMGLTVEQVPEENPPFEDDKLNAIFLVWKLARETMRADAIAICRTAQADVEGDMIEEML